MQKKTITAKDIVSKFNITYHSLNYYTTIGLLPIVTRKGNKRLYDESIVEDRLKRISQMVSEGYPLGLIRKKLLEA